MTGYRCEGCKAQFHRLGGFEKHRVGSFAKGHGRGKRRCLTPTEMGQAGLVQDAAGFWKFAAAHDFGEQSRTA